MQAVRLKNSFLLVCCLESLFLLIAQIIGDLLLLLPCLVFFLVLVGWSAVRGMAMPVLLFFLPFASLLKFQPGTISFYTIALLVVYVVYLINGFQEMNVNYFVPGLMVVALSLFAKAMCGYKIDNSFIFFAASLLLIPLIKRELNQKYDFYQLTLYFALGIVVASITSQHVMHFPNLARYIGMHEAYGAFRHSGYYRDPNFYAAHVTAALGGGLILLLKGLQKGRMTVLVLMVMVLLYCGFLSISKSFMLIAILLLLLWFVEFAFKKGNLSAKLMVFLVSFVGIFFLLSSTVFVEAFNVSILRFGSGKSLSDFTTRRTDIWLQYLKAFLEDPWLLFFGEGGTKVLINGRGSHNTVIQMIYQFGVVGCSCLCAWFVCVAREFLAGVKLEWKNLTQLGILLLGAIGPWMALDLLFVDEFFLIPVYVYSGIVFLTGKDTASDSLARGERGTLKNE